MLQSESAGPYWFGDNERAWFGDGVDAQIYYDGASFIFDSDVVGGIGPVIDFVTGGDARFVSPADFIFQLGDAIGATSFTINNSLAEPIFDVDSLGNLDIYGTTNFVASAGTITQGAAFTYLFGGNAVNDVLKLQASSTALNEYIVLDNGNGNIYQVSAGEQHVFQEDAAQFAFLNYTQFRVISQAVGTTAFLWEAAAVDTGTVFDIWGFNITTGNCLRVRVDGDEITTGNIFVCTSGPTATDDLVLVKGSGLTENYDVAGDSRYMRSKHIGAGEMSGGGSGSAIFVVPGQSQIGLRCTSVNHFAYFCMKVDDDWDNGTDLNVKVRVFWPIAQTADDRCLVNLMCWSGQPSESCAAMHTQTVVWDDTIGGLNGQYVVKDLEFTIDHDLGAGQITTWDTLWFRLEFPNLGAANNIDDVAVSDAWCDYMSYYMSEKTMRW